MLDQNTNILKKTLIEILFHWSRHFKEANAKVKRRFFYNLREKRAATLYIVGTIMAG